MIRLDRCAGCNKEMPNGEPVYLSGGENYCWDCWAGRVRDREIKEMRDGHGQSGTGV